MSTQKDKQNKTANPESDSIWKYINMIKVVLQITRVKFNKWCWNNWKKIKLDPLFKL